MVRRVGSLRAAKVASRLAEYLTIRLCISPDKGACQGLAIIPMDELGIDLGKKSIPPLNNQPRPPIESPATYLHSTNGTRP
jgi:hypothetical protein